jgi:hypothetical protein
MATGREERVVSADGRVMSVLVLRFGGLIVYRNIELLMIMFILEAVPSIARLTGKLINKVIPIQFLKTNIYEIAGGC